MRCRSLLSVVGLFVAACALAADPPPAAPAPVPAPAPALKLPSVLGSNMVLQQGMPVPVWGWAKPGETVSVAFAGQTKTAVAAADGRWQVKLDALKASAAPADMLIASAADKTETGTVKLTNILVGEVWIGSGQSNMQFGLGGAVNAQAEIAAADYSNIRLFSVGLVAPVTPQADCQGQWTACSPQTAGGFSAVLYFFGRKLHKDLNVPVGLIQTAWGGTPAESWTSREALAANPELQLFVERLDTVVNNGPETMKKYEEAKAAWEKEKAAAAKDSTGWEKAEFADAAWKTMDLPQNWENAGLNIDGTVWFRKAIDIPEALAGQDLLLQLGPIDDNDVTYFNGQKVGETAGWTIPRKYAIPAALAKAGPAVIAVCVVDTGGGGGLHGQPGDLQLAPAAATGKGTPIALKGAWKYEIAQEWKPAPQAPMGPGNPWVPTSLYDGMIAPLVPYAIRGATWYQGESNAGRAFQYRTLFPAMIADWRQRWGQGDFPFLFVQLANFTAALADPGESDWAELREAQTMTLALPNTGMACIIDIGDAADIHPRNKQDVGLRLALWALANTYATKDLVCSGPLYKSMKVEGGAVRLSFTHTGSGLVAKDGDLQQFAIAGADKKFVWARARIEGNAVVVSSDQVAAPVAVRYAWANNPAGCNLYNKEGLPASPFRTDDWPGITVNNK